MTDYGFKVLRGDKTGSVLTAGIDDLLLHSDYPMFKYHDTYSASVTFNPGDTTKTISITHGLGYVPAFIPYGIRNDDNKAYIVPPLPYGIDEFNYSESWADTTKVYLKTTLYEPWNQELYYSDGVGWDFESDGLAIVVGGYDGGKGSAWHFPSITSSGGSPSSVELMVGNVFSAGSGNTKYKVYGIDEDNVGTPVYPGMTKTSAYDAREQSVVGGKWDFQTDVKDQYNEIVTRGGWSSGNAMGFILENNGSNGSNYIFTVTSSVWASLTITRSGTLTVNYRVVVFKDKISD